MAPVTRSSEPGTLSLPGTVSLFGFPTTEAVVGVLPRRTSWRGVRAGAFFLGGLVLAPAVGMVPPHAPWALGVLAVGAVLGTRKWREYFTLVSFVGNCPKCGAPLEIHPGVPAQAEMSVPCEGCHHDSRLSLHLPQGGASA